MEEAEAVSPPMQRNILGELPVRATNTILQRCRFLTIEQPIDIEKALPKIKAGSSVLLECISNLTANEMFLNENPEKNPRSCKEVTDSVVEGIQSLKQKTGHLVIVTNNVFEDGINYEEGTMEYLRAIGSINEKLADMADEVIEVVVGIPLVIKGGK